MADKWQHAQQTGLFLSEDEARYYFRQFVTAVAYCHAHNVAHRCGSFETPCFIQHYHIHCITGRGLLPCAQCDAHVGALPSAAQPQNCQQVVTPAAYVHARGAHLGADRFAVGRIQ